MLNISLGKYLQLMVVCLHKPSNNKELSLTLNEKVNDMDRENEQEIIDMVVDVVVEQLGVDKEEVALEKSFVEDLNADSLDQTELIMTFEERCGFEISEEDAETLRTVGDVVSYIKNKKEATSNA